MLLRRRGHSSNKEIFKRVNEMHKRKLNKFILLSVITMALNLALLILFTGVWEDYQAKGIMLTTIANMLVAVVVMIGESEG